MASIYKRRKSPYFWLKFKDERGEIKQISTKFRIDCALDVRRARKMAAERTAQELTIARPHNGSDWNWVRDFFKVRYQSRPATFERYNCCWDTVELFLGEKKILSPAHLQRSHCFDYMTWRQKPNKSKGKYRAGHNTALTDLKILRIVMREAVERALCPANPCVQLGIKKAQRKLKPELTDEHCELIRATIAKVKDPDAREFFHNSFEIARYQGCRLSETRVNPQTDVDLKRNTISFKAKGGKDFVTALHPKLVPLFTRLRSEGKTSTWDMPDEASRQLPAIRWSKFIRRHGLKKLIGDGMCFHSTRVTVVTRLARADVSISKAKWYVGHASTTIHDTYQRLRPDDLRGCTEAVT
jgi:site-specific recombinase XerD